MDDNPVRVALEELIKECGGQRQAAEKLCVNPSYISQLLSGRVSIPGWIGEKLGYQKVWIKKESVTELTGGL